MARNRNPQAALFIRQLRVDKGLSPEALGAAIMVDGKTIRLIENTGRIPTPRVQFAIADYFGMKPSEIWANRSRVTA